MNIDEFWTIVDRIHIASNNDMDFKCRLLADELRQFTPVKVQSFKEHSSDCLYQAYTWDIWGAAYIINGGCSDDGFMDFRSTLISLGRVPFEAAIANADSLADFNIDPAWATYEGYQYVAVTVYKEMTGNEVPRSKSHPIKTLGVPFNEWEMSPRFPKLVVKYGYKDSDSFYMKEQQEKCVKDDHAGDRLATLMLEGGIVSSSGLVPPPRIVAKVLRTGHAPESIGRQFTWEPVELDERHYWIAMVRLNGIQPNELRSQPELRGIRISSDVDASEANDFDDWTRTLKDRGLA